MTAPRDSNLRLILLCFFLSGFAALLYQTAWTREFAFVFGTSDLAVVAVLAAYMGGLALGAAIAARLAPSIRRPVLVYGVLELGIAVCALAVPYGIRASGRLTALLVGVGETGADPGWLAGVLRLAIAFSLLLPPTALMGATLPLLARYVVHTDEQVGPRIGALYSINTAGAIFGTLCAAFLLLPAVGLRWTVYSGAAVNGLVFIAAALVARRSTSRVPVQTSMKRGAANEDKQVGRWVLPMMTLSGAISFAYEVLWTRLLSQILGGSVYAFSTMLASFLLGITIGSAIGARFSKTRAAATIGFSWAQIGTATLVLAAFAMANMLPEIARSLGASTTGSGPRNAALAGIVLLPFTICIGATFPFAVRIVSTGAESSSGATARVYAWNTVGSIVGAIGAGFFLLPTLGFAGLITLGCVLNLGLAAATGLIAKPRLRLPLLAATAGLLTLSLVRLGQPWALLRTISNGDVVSGEITYFAVGRSSTVLLVDKGNEWWLFNNGLQESVIEKPGSLPNRGMTVRWLGLLGPLLHANAESLLVIGLGGGVVVEAVPSNIEVIDVIELEDEVVKANRFVGDGRMIDPFDNPHVRVLVNDARGALMLSNTRYDAIVSQPSHPWTAGASHLYTREFFELIRDHLTDDGVFTQWIDIALIDEQLLKSIVATLGAVYDNVEVYGPNTATLLFAASNSPLDISASAASAIARAPEHFARYGIYNTEDVASTLLMASEGSRIFSRGAVENTDDMNLLSTRSVRLAPRDRLNPDRIASLLGPHDPLSEFVDRLDLGRLLRPLSRRSDGMQIDRLVGSLGAYDRAMALGWKAKAQESLAVARRYFETALELRPGDPDANAGFIVSRGVPDTEAPESLLALFKAFELSGEEKHDEIGKLDGALAELGPNSPAYDEANRMRVRWRLEVGGPEHSAEALELVDRGLARGGISTDYLLRAQAAVGAKRYAAAWTAISAFGEFIGPTEQGRNQAKLTLQLLRKIPDGREHPMFRKLTQLSR